MKIYHWPPRFFLRFFRWFCHPGLLNHIEGDLIEDYNERLRQKGKGKANLRFIVDVLLLFRPGIIRPANRFSEINQTAMLKSYFKIALRTIRKNKAYSTINVLGLALGICACLTIFLVVDHEFSFDKFHRDSDRIYRLTVQGSNQGERWYDNCVPAPAPLAIRSEIPGMEAVTAVHHYNPIVKVPQGNNAPKQFEVPDAGVIITDPEYFSLFSYTWLAGNPSALNEPFNVVLTDTRAHDYFGLLSADEILGKEILYDSMVMTVAGVVQHWEQNTDFPATDFISFATIKNSKLANSINLDAWTSIMHSSQAFVKLSPGSSSAELTGKLTALIQKHDSDSQSNKSTIEMGLQPLGDIHFNPGNVESPGLLPTLYVLIGLAFFILIIAVVNFVNLSTAQSIRRSKEMGIRKVLGGMRRGLTFQFLTETFVLTAMAAGVAALLVTPVLSWFSDFVPRGVRFDLLNTNTLIFLVAITFGTSLLAGFYPAKVLSSHLPSVSLKGVGVQTGGETWFVRKGLIVFQFSISLFFIVGTIVINDQLHYIQSKDKGFTTSDIVTIRTKWNDSFERTKVFSERVKQLSGVADVALQSMPPMGFGMWSSSFSYKGKNPVVDASVSVKPGTSDFIPFYNFQLVAGRNIMASDTLQELVINQRALKTFGFKDADEALGQELLYNDKPYPIVGVVADFHEQSFHDPIGPAVIGNFNFPARGIAVKFPPLKEGETNRTEVMAQVAKIFKDIYPDETFNGRLIDDEIGAMHERDQRTSTLARISMMITVFISCMGIFGLSMFTSEMRVKEIGIRKVLGATVVEIAAMLSKEFLILIALAALITTPVSWLFMNNWLMKFAYRIDLTIWVYLLSALAALSIGLFTISFKTLSAARANPVDSLRSE
jgi:putative ABC transport system permease protein